MSLLTHLVPSLDQARPGTVITVEGEEAHHAVAVRRLRVGEEIQLTDGRGRVGVGAVEETGKRRFAVRLDAVDEVPEPTPVVTVVQALPKGDRGERAVEMLTEIGVATIVPWAAERSIAAWRGERIAKGEAKWRATAREAAKQSRRAWLPQVTSLTRTEDLADLIGAADLALVLHEAASTPMASLEVPSTGSILLVVGPEGGLSEEEIATLHAAGARAVRLGTEVLRTSTAGVAAVSALLSRTPRWS